MLAERGWCANGPNATSRFQSYSIQALASIHYHTPVTHVQPRAATNKPKLNGAQKAVLVGTLSHYCRGQDPHGRVHDRPPHLLKLSEICRSNAKNLLLAVQTVHCRDSSGAFRLGSLLFHRMTCPEVACRLALHPVCVNGHAWHSMKTYKLLTVLIPQFQVDV